MEERLAEANRFRDAVNAYRAAKRGEPTAEPAQAIALLRRAPVNQLTELPDWPLNRSPPAEAPDYGSMAQAITHRRRKVGAQLPAKPFGEPQLVKKGDLRRTAE
jgi:hypothetical protein